MSNEESNLFEQELEKLLDQHDYELPEVGDIRQGVVVSVNNYKDFFVNITPDDNALELDNIALINLTDNVKFYDGEVEFTKDNKRFLLNRIIGFFEVDRILNHLNEKDIPCGVYYPIPLHLQKAYTNDSYKADDFKVTLQLIKEVISLPMHTELADDQIDFITDTIKKFLG
mgnify:CR=1 FL=1